MKRGGTYLVIAKSNVDISLVDKVIFSLKGESTIKKEYPSEVTYENNIFTIPLTQENTIALGSKDSKRTIEVEGQINYTSKAVEFTEVSKFILDKTINNPTVVTGNTPSKISLAELELNVKDGVIIANVKVPEELVIETVESYVEEHKEEFKGDKGDKGEDGTDGYTPKKGIDYFTDAEIDGIVTEIIGEITPEFVEKEDGKGLSSNDYTDSDKQKVQNALQSSQKGSANGLAELDENGFIPKTQIPASCDQIEEFDTVDDFPTVGVTEVIYIAKNTNVIYRWSGTQYVEISPSLALGELSSTAYRGDRGKTAYDHSQLTSGNPHNVTKANVGLGNVDNTSDLQKPISNATQTALNAKANASDLVFEKNGTNGQLTDSADGSLRDILIWGRSEQGENPSPDNPQTIHVVDKPKVVITDEDDNENSATLDITLNAIEVTSGENVTINGKKYLADYVDMDRECIVRMIGKKDLGTVSDVFSQNLTYRIYAVRLSDMKQPTTSHERLKGIMCNKYIVDTIERLDENMTDKSCKRYGNAFEIRNTDYATVQEFTDNLSGTIGVYELAVPTTEALTAEQLSALKSLKTYNSVSNVSLTSDDLDSRVDYKYFTSNAFGKMFAELYDRKSAPFDFAISDGKYGFMRDDKFVPFYNQYPKIEIVSEDTTQFAFIAKGIGTITSKITSSNIPYETDFDDDYGFENIGNSSILCTDGKIIFGNPFTYKGMGETFTSVIAETTELYDGTQVGTYFGDYKDVSSAEYTANVNGNVTYFAICVSGWQTPSSAEFVYTDESGTEHTITPTRTKAFNTSGGYFGIYSFELSGYVGSIKATYNGMYRVQPIIAWY